MLLITTFLLPVLTVVSINLLLHRLHFKFSVLPEEAYFTPIIILQLLRYPQTLLMMIGPTLILLMNFQALSWSKIEQGNILSYFIFFVSLILAWTYGTYDYNLYYNRPHYLDRLLLIVLAFLILASPIFVPIFLVLVMVIIGQFNYPIGGYPWTDKRVLLDVLILFNAALYLKLFDQPIASVFLFLVLCLHAGNYVVPAIDKLQIGWLKRENLDNLVATSYIYGWLGFLNENHIVKIIGIVKRFNRPLIIFTLLVELIPLLMFLDKRLAIVILLAAILLHFGIFVSSGIFFWKWIFLNIGLVLVIILDQFHVNQLFTWPYFLTSVSLILLSKILFRSISLVWYDTPFVHSYELEGISQSGTAYRIPRYFMSPYDVVFAQNRFFYLSDDKVLVGTFGTTRNWDIAKRLKNVDGPTDIEMLRKLKGVNYYNPDQVKRFDHFIRTYFRNLNKRVHKDIFINKFAPPSHIWNFSRGNIYKLQEPIQEVRVRYAEVYFDGHKFQTLRTKFARVIDKISFAEEALNYDVSKM